jgi:hypothetical protein
MMPSGVLTGASGMAGALIPDSAQMNVITKSLFMVFLPPQFLNFIETSASSANLWSKSKRSFVEKPAPPAAAKIRATHCRPDRTNAWGGNQFITVFKDAEAVTRVPAPC